MLVFASDRNYYHADRFPHEVYISCKGPKAFDISALKLWLRDNIKGLYYITNKKIVICFENENDAVLCKLVWG